jgi:hypothetical protein
MIRLLRTGRLRRLFDGIDPIRTLAVVVQAG